MSQANRLSEDVARRHRAALGIMAATGGIALALVADGETRPGVPAVAAAAGAMTAGLAGAWAGCLAVAARRVTAAVDGLDAARARMEHQALHDALTGLPNRRYLDDHLGRAIAAAARNGETLAVLHLDLDGFKAVNDTLGHAAGDAVLAAAAKGMQASLRAADFLARVGGDEFVVVVPVVRSVEGLGALADRLIERLEEPIPFEGQPCRIGVSIGIALAPPAEAPSPARLLNNADVALYAAKHAGKGRYRIHGAREENAPALSVVG